MTEDESSSRPSIAQGGDRERILAWIYHVHQCSNSGSSHLRLTERPSDNSHAAPRTLPPPPHPHHGPHGPDTRPHRYVPTRQPEFPLSVRPFQIVDSVDLTRHRLATDADDQSRSPHHRGSTSRFPHTAPVGYGQHPQTQTQTWDGDRPQESREHGRHSRRLPTSAPPQMSSPMSSTSTLISMGSLRRTSSPESRNGGTYYEATTPSTARPLPQRPPQSPRHSLVYPPQTLNRTPGPVGPVSRTYTIPPAGLPLAAPTYVHPHTPPPPGLGYPAIGHPTTSWTYRGHGHLSRSPLPYQHPSSPTYHSRSPSPYAARSPSSVFYTPPPSPYSPSSYSSFRPSPVPSPMSSPIPPSLPTPPNVSPQPSSVVITFNNVVAIPNAGAGPNTSVVHAAAKLTHRISATPNSTPSTSPVAPNPSQTGTIAPPYVVVIMPPTR